MNAGADMKTRVVGPERKAPARAQTDAFVAGDTGVQLDEYPEYFFNLMLTPLSSSNDRKS